MSKTLTRKQLSRFLTLVSEMKEEFVTSYPDDVPALIINGAIYPDIVRIVTIEQRADIDDQPLTGNWKLSVLNMPVIMNAEFSKDEILVADYYEYYKVEYSR